MKRCGACHQEKSAEDFYPDRKRPGALHTYCKPCCRTKAKARYAADPGDSYRRHKEWVERNRDRVRMHKIKFAYGITAEEFDAIPQVCVICGSTERLRVDHSHQTGRVRGMLCDLCNKGLGFFHDHPALLLRAADYVLGVADPAIFSATSEAIR